MKKLVYIFAALFALAGCHGYIDPEAGPQDDQDIPEEYTSPFTFSADNQAIEADGKDVATLSLKDAYGREMMNDQTININIQDEYGNYLERGTKSVRAIANGVRTYTAIYRGQKSNALSIMAQNRSKYEKYAKKVAIYKITGTGCMYCPSMTKALDAIDEDASAHSVVMAWHGGSTSWIDPFAITYEGFEYDCATVLQKIFAERTGKSMGYPSLVLDLNLAETQRSSSAISKAIWECRAQHPATCGLKMSSRYNQETGKVDIEVELASSTGGQYDVGFSLLLDGEYVADGKEPQGLYNHIVVANSGNFYTYFSDRIAEVGKDQTKKYTYSLSSSTVNISSKISKVTAVAYAIVKGDDGNARIDNIVSAPVGESVDYRLND